MKPMARWQWQSINPVSCCIRFGLRVVFLIKALPVRALFVFENADVYTNRAVSWTTSWTENRSELESILDRAKRALCIRVCVCGVCACVVLMCCCICVCVSTCTLSSVCAFVVYMYVCLCMYLCRVCIHECVCTFVHVLSLVSSTHMGLACRESEGNGLSREMTGNSRSSSDEANVMTSSDFTARWAAATTLGLRCVHYFFAPCVCAHISHPCTHTHYHTCTHTHSTHIHVHTQHPQTHAHTRPHSTHANTNTHIAHSHRCQT